MARPIKNYCDYFPHDRDMRNHRKVKAIRTKYGVVGYAIWSMILEYLTGIDGNVFEYSDIEFELMAGDFGVSATEIRSVIDYCIKFEMLFLNNGFINSESLDERLKPVYEKRGKSKDNSKKQQRLNGKFIPNNTVCDGVSVTEMPQSKVNKSKVNKNPYIDLDISDEFNENEKIKIKMVVVEMYKIWQDYNPIYPKDEPRDYHALLQFAYKIAENKKWSKSDIVGKREKDVISSWDKIAKYIMSNSFLRDKPLSTCINQWQSIFMGMQKNKGTDHLEAKRIEEEDYFTINNNM